MLLLVYGRNSTLVLEGLPWPATKKPAGKHHENVSIWTKDINTFMEQTDLKGTEKIEHEPDLLST